MTVRTPPLSWAGSVWGQTVTGLPVGIGARGGK